MTEEILQSGATIDTRPVEKQEKDFKFEEVVASANPVEWVEKTEYRKFPIFDQNGSGSCVAQTEAKEMGIMRWLEDGNYIHFSATDIYQRRSNKPAGGMWATDARDIVRRGGATLEVLTPSQSMTDIQMDGTEVEPYKREIGEVFKVPNYIALPIKDIESVASVIQTTGKAVMIWIYFTYDEWTTEPVVKNPQLGISAPGTVRHSVAAVDFTLKNGKRYIVIEDSWGPKAGDNGCRLISEDFLKARNYYSGYLVNFRFDEPTPPSQDRPNHTFRNTLRFSSTFTNDPEVKVLQEILKYEGLFPANIAATGYYGSITAKHVLLWQKKHKVDADEALEALGGRIVGPKTRAKLNETYSR